MKIVVAFVVLIVMAGAAVGALFYLKLPPFAAAAPKKAGGSKSKVRVAQARSSATAPAATNVTTAPAAPPTRTAPAIDRAKVARLSSIYEQMPAEDASRVMAKLPDPLVQRILAGMDERQVGKLLGLFPPDRAASLTRALAR
jgi:hypothetical protein